MNLPRQVDDMLTALLAGIRHVLEDNLVGVYLRGSLATGDFIPETSDLDILAVTERPVDDESFAALAALHVQLAVSPNPYANRLEIAYIDRQALKRFQPGLRHPTLGQGESLAWSEHHDNWLLERWVVREHGVALLGPHPQTLIDPIAPQDLTAAVRGRLRDWVDWANQPDDPDWSLPRSHKAYVVETMCRALYTMACGELSSKAHAMRWALKILPEPWRSIIERSMAWRTDDTVDLSIVSEIMEFIHWVAVDGEETVRGNQTSSCPEIVTLTRTAIEEGLQQIGLARGDVVEVHSALSSLGWVEGGAATVVDALMNVVGEQGALVMSAYRVSKPLPLTEQEKARGILAKVRLYDRDYDGPTGMGAIADEFCRRPGTILGPDDGGPICAWGRNAERLSEGYERLIEADGWALLIGVDIYRCSSMHVAEDRVPVPEEIGKHYQLPEDILRDYPPDEWYVIHSEPTESEPQLASESVGAWEKVQAEAERRGLIVKKSIGNATCMLFKAQQLVEIYAEARRTDPFGLYNVKKA